ncbi:DUF5131 family protein [Algihabitans albus]|uniref:DUF5131 family protein n=1 Tax=Algihabitans albus TaxID=2164067 RepID=UPI000E5C5EAA|nr:DUF5131 family protein [Algihabitans albus]
MGDRSLIEWTDATWNPVTGCWCVSPGCAKCYAMKLAGGRLRNHPSRAGLTQPSKAGPVWNGEIRVNEEWMEQPLRWSRPRMIFTVAHGDLFYEKVPVAVIDRVHAVMALAPWHIYQVLTKRSERAARYYADPDLPSRLARETQTVGRNLAHGHIGLCRSRFRRVGGKLVRRLPLRNVLVGVSVEDQARANQRLEDIAHIAAGGWRTWVSYEPALGPVDWSGYEFIYWLVSGGESGPHARPSHPEWHRAARDWCAANDIPYLFKQWGAFRPATAEELPERFGPECDAFKVICSNGFVGDLSLETAFRHKPAHWPQCFPRGPEGDCCCNPIEMVRIGKKAAGNLLDGRQHLAFPDARELAA